MVHFPLTFYMQPRWLGQKRVIVRLHSEPSTNPTPPLHYTCHSIYNLVFFNVTQTSLTSLKISSKFAIFCKFFRRFSKIIQFACRIRFGWGYLAPKKWGLKCDNYKWGSDPSIFHTSFIFCWAAWATRINSEYSFSEKQSFEILNSVKNTNS